MQEDLEWIEENFPDLSEKYPFEMIPEERIIGNEIGQLFCVVPRSGDDPSGDHRTEDEL